MAINYYLYGIILCVMLLLVIAIWFLLRYTKKKKERNTLTMNIPEDVFNDFQEAERRIRQGGAENGEPYKILWEIANKRNSRGRTSSGNQEGDSRFQRLPTSPGVGTAVADSSTTDGYLQRNREPDETRSVPLQSNIESTEVKRKPKINWVNFK